MAAAAAGAASSRLPPTSPRRLPFPPTRKPLAAAPKTLTFTPKPFRLQHPLASSSSFSCSSSSLPPPPSPPGEAKTNDPSSSPSPARPPTRRGIARLRLHLHLRLPLPAPSPPQPQPSAWVQQGGRWSTGTATGEDWVVAPRCSGNRRVLALKEGDELMTAGRLKQALPYYEKVMQAVDFKSKEAMSTYSKLKYHPNVEISKKVNMFMFSFQAMDFMKVNSSPLPWNTGYEAYFDKFGGRKNYYPSLGEPDMGIDQITPYMIFLVFPMFFVAFIALRKSFQL